MIGEKLINGKMYKTIKDKLKAELYKVSTIVDTICIINYTKISFKMKRQIHNELYNSIKLLLLHIPQKKGI